MSEDNLQIVPIRADTGQLWGHWMKKAIDGGIIPLETIRRDYEAIEDLLGLGEKMLRGASKNREGLLREALRRVNYYYPSVASINPSDVLELLIEAAEDPDYGALLRLSYRAGLTGAKSEAEALYGLCQLKAPERDLKIGIKKLATALNIIEGIRRV